MSELTDKLLQKISDDKPCGPDPAYDPAFDELENLLKGKPEVDIGSVKKPAEPPEWGELQAKSLEFLRKSKHLRGAVILSCCQLKTAGLPGFRDGLQLIRGLLEQYWGAVYPLLDPEDNNDPTQRLNILTGLTAPRGSVSGWLTVLDYLYATPLCRPKGAPPATYEQLQNAQLSTPPEGTPTLASLQAALRSAPDQVAASRQALEEALEATRGIDQFLTNTLSAGKTMSFEELQKALQGMSSALQAYLPGAQEPGAAPETTGSVGEAVPSVAVQVTGSIRSPEDVVRTLESICRYYDQVERSSPVPYLLRRAQKLARMNFVEAMKELSLATPEALRPSMGSAVDAEAAPAAETPPASA